MRAFVLTFCISTSLAAAERYRVDGLLLDVDVTTRTILVSHRPIAGFMPAMTMPLRVQNARELVPLYRGARVTFELVVSGTESYARKVRKVRGDAVEFGTPREAVAIGDRVPNFELTAHDGGAVRLADFAGKLVAVNFIYTRCPLPNVCPRLAANFAVLQRRFRERLDRDLILLSITLDPQYDTPRVLAQYAKQWQTMPGWCFLTGSTGAIERVARSLGVLYWPEDGILAHTSMTALIGRDGRLRASVEGSSYRADQLAELVARELDEGR